MERVTRPVFVPGWELTNLRREHERVGADEFGSEGACSCGQSRLWEQCLVVRLIAMLDGDDVWDDQGKCR